jgi:hypothetical protein
MVASGDGQWWWLVMAVSSQSSSDFGGGGSVDPTKSIWLKHIMYNNAQTVGLVWTFERNWISCKMACRFFL